MDPGPLGRRAEATRENVYGIVSEAKWDVLKWMVGMAIAQLLLVGVIIKLL